MKRAQYLHRYTLLSGTWLFLNAAVAVLIGLTL
jgi:hypothetical protein